VGKDGNTMHDMAILSIIDTLHYVTHSEKDIGTGFNIKGSLQMP
jgi:hypothetical protein